MVGKPEYEIDNDVKFPYKIKLPDGTFKTGIVPKTGESVDLILKLTPREVRMQKFWGNEPVLVEPEEKGGIWKSQPNKDKDLDTEN